MHSNRTGGMTTMGILNIIFGSLGTLGSLLIVLGGGLLAAGGAAMEASGDPNAAGLGTMGAIGGGLFVVIGLVAMVLCIMLLVAGIGLLKVAPWGRTLSMVCGFSFLGLNTLSLLGGIDPGALIGIGYSIVLLGLCFSAQWKRAFSGQPGQAGVFAPVAVAPSGFAGMPLAGSVPADPDAVPQPMQPQPQAVSNDAPAEGFSSMPGIPSSPQAETRDPQQPIDTSDGEEPNNDISSFAA